MNRTMLFWENTKPCCDNSSNCSRQTRTMLSTEPFGRAGPPRFGSDKSVCDASTVLRLPCPLEPREAYTFRKPSRECIKSDKTCLRSICANDARDSRQTLKSGWLRYEIGDIGHLEEEPIGYATCGKWEFTKTEQSSGLIPQE